MPRPFRKGIACHGSMPVRPFSPESFVALYNDELYLKNLIQANPTPSKNMMAPNIVEHVSFKKRVSLIIEVYS